MNLNINLVYIDDRLDNELSNYLFKHLPSDLAAAGYENVNIDHRDIRYEPSNGFAWILNNPDVRRANIAIIDSKLFENETFDSTMLSGEELLVILKRFFPFIESHVISQVETRRSVEPQILPKWNPIDNTGISPEDFYRNHLAPEIIRSIENIRALRSASEKLNLEIVDPITLERIQNSIEGTQDYDDLTRSDINKAIEHFEEIRKLVADSDE